MPAPSEQKCYGWAIAEKSTGFTLAMAAETCAGWAGGWWLG